MKNLNPALGLAALLLAAGGVSGATTAAKAPADSTFMKTAAAAGLAEVECGKLAAEKASNPDIKSFAQMLVDDHSKANEELKGLAGQKNVTLPSAPTAAQKAAQARLSKLSGAAFDSAYVHQMVRDHAAAVALFTRESKAGADADAKAWAGKTLPTLEAHSTKAKELAGTKTAHATK